MLDAINSLDMTRLKSVANDPSTPFTDLLGALKIVEEQLIPLARMRTEGRYGENHLKHLKDKEPTLKAMKKALNHALQRQNSLTLASGSDSVFDEEMKAAMQANALRMKIQADLDAARRKEQPVDRSRVFANNWPPCIRGKK
ncbi:Uncharacterised protein [Candidatus Gugararchaeum adminiculabundum]|nr:Uncharacterised protein [Candidatus Gugararchaeum adminiculabundum]